MIPGPLQWVKGSGIATAVAEVTAVARTQSLAGNLSYAAGVAIKKKKSLQTEVNTNMRIKYSDNREFIPQIKSIPAIWMRK